MTTTQVPDLDNLTRKSSNSRQSEKTIYQNCAKKYRETKVLLENLEQKKVKLEEEIKHLQQKQLDRKKFLDEVRERHQKS